MTKHIWINSGDHRRYSLLLSIMFVVLIFSITSSAQTKATTLITGKNILGPKSLTFDVVSIHPSKPGSGESIQWGWTPGGYTARGQSLRSTILVAYSQEGTAKGELINAPSWINDLYDIDAKVAPNDIEEWQKQTPERRKMLQEMLQSMLSERCNLSLRRIPTTITGYALVSEKRGEKLKKSSIDTPIPSAHIRLTDGGKVVYTQKDDKAIWTFYNTSMPILAKFLTNAGNLVLDKTGLSEKYDFVLTPLETFGESESDPPLKNMWDLDKIGLKLDAIQIQGESFVIEHIEKPSPN